MSTNAIASITARDSVKATLPDHERSHSLRRVLLVGSATLGVAIGTERALGFIANVLAARIGGPQMFGGYSVVLATAGTIAAYAGAGIGTTAIRFSGQYPRESPGYRRFIWAIALVSLVSAIVSSLIMLTGAGFLAKLVLHNETLASVLRVAAISSAAIILLECCRGLLIGQQRLQSLVVLSAVCGIGLIVVLPLAARVDARLMIAGQGSVALFGVLLCVTFSKRLGIRPKDGPAVATGPGIGAVVRFGLFQLAAFAGVSAASWLVALWVTRSDSTLTQMGLYAIGNQFRGLTALAPVLCAQVGYSLLTDESASKFGGPRHVMMTNSLLSTLLAVGVAGVAIILAPSLLLVIYGKSFAGAEMPILILMATGIVHMSGGPAMQRLTIVSLRSLGIINAIWAIAVVIAAVWLVPTLGAVGAAVAFLIGHALAQVLVTLVLMRLRELPAGYVALTITFLGGAVLMSALGSWRAVATTNRFILTLGLVGSWGVVMAAVWLISVRTGCLAKWSKKPLNLLQA